MKTLNPTVVRGRYARWFVYSTAAVIVAYLLVTRVFSATFDNGFDLSDALVPVDEIHHGGPPRDGIPALDSPRFVTAGEADFLDATDRVLGMAYNGVAKAFPVRILNYHEIVNDEIGGEPVMVSFCPLCGTGIAFSARVAGQTRSFGVSGLLYNSDLLLYDRQSESLWSQVMGKAISGPLRGEVLDRRVLDHTTWSDWRARHPDTLVLSTRTGHQRDYSRDPYPGYATDRGIYFPVARLSRRYHPKEQVLGVEINGVRKAYPFAELSQGPRVIDDEVGGQMLRILFDPENRTARVTAADGTALPGVIAFWFAWFAFFPETAVYEAP
jgi:hypothetical protein